MAKLGYGTHDRFWHEQRASFLFDGQACARECQLLIKTQNLKPKLDTRTAALAFLPFNSI